MGMTLNCLFSKVCARGGALAPAVMHVQILEIDMRLRARYVANAPHLRAMLIKAAGWVEPAKRPEC